MKSMGPLFDDVIIEPCLLHGDLWSGNISSDKNGEPVILDPACYCKLLYIYLLVPEYILGCELFQELHVPCNPEERMMQW